MGTNDDRPRILVLHKPIGYEVTRPKSLDQLSIYSLLPPEFHKGGWVPVGRLDKASSGLILFVEDGSLVARLQKPGNLEKVYEVQVRGPVEPEQAQKIVQGVKTPLGILSAKSVEILATKGNISYARVVLEEGKNRQVRRLFAALRAAKHHRPMKVLALKRVRFGPIQLDVEEGKWRFLSEEEMEGLLKAVHPQNLKPGRRP